MEGRADNTLAIISIVCGGLGFVLSLIPCVGFIGIPLGIIGLILGAIAYMKAKDNGSPKTMAFIGLGLSVLPMIVSLAYFLTFKNATSDFKADIKTYTSCDSLMIDMKEVALEIKDIERDLEENEGKNIIKNMSRITKFAMKMESMQEQARELNCEDFDFDSSIDSLGVKIDADIKSDSLGGDWDF